MGHATTHECTRCGEEFHATATHTEIVRRDFVDVPRPASVERFCRDCWEAYVTEFLGEEFDTDASRRSEPEPG